jgi:arginine repressor
LTQDAYYWTDDAAVARADNAEGDRSAVVLVAPGATTVHAAFADWSGDPKITGSVAGAFLAVEP